MSTFEQFLTLPYSSLFILLIACGVVTTSMIVNRLMINMDRLQYVTRAVRKYNEELKRAQTRGDKTALRRLEREERKLRQMSSYTQKQRMKAMLITVIPFSAISILLGLYLSERPVAVLPFETPYGRYINFYIWYLLCYFSAYLPFTRIFGLGIVAEIPRPAREKGGKR